jgi:uncharacterized protein (DUF58 family)
LALPAAPHTVPRPGWRQHWQAWWIRRQPPSDALTLTHHNVYILPTRAGWMLGLTLLVMLVGSINYQLNLGYLLTFLIAGSSAVAMHQTHANLRRLQLQVRAIPPVFAGQSAQVPLSLHNPGRQARHALGLRWQGDRSASASNAWTDAEAGGSSQLSLALPTRRRGRQALPPIEIETRFPLGTFRAWSWWRPAATLLVYPSPEASAPPCPAGARPEDPGRQGPSHPGPGDEDQGVRPWRRGDPLKWVVWKKVARQWASGRDPWVSRDFDRPPPAERWLDLAVTGLGPGEAGLSRLCAWALRSEAEGTPYGLILPGVRIAPDHGPNHLQRCLEALALC